MAQGPTIAKSSPQQRSPYAKKIIFVKIIQPKDDYETEIIPAIAAGTP